MSVANNLINQICIHSGLQGRELERLQARLANMNEAELQAELSKSIAGSNYSTNLGLVVEKTSSDTTSNTQTQPIIQNEQQCKDVTIQLLKDNLEEAVKLYDSQYLGAISGTYDKAKSSDNKLKSSNISKVINYQTAGIEQLDKANKNNLSKREYYLENKERLKEMILTRLTVLETPTGSNYMESLRGKYTKEQLTEIISDYVDVLCANASMEELKTMQQDFLSYKGEDEAAKLTILVDNAKKYNEDSLSNDSITDGSIINTKISSKGEKIPPEWNSGEPISFEEVYKFERGIEYSQSRINQYLTANAELMTVVAAQNKKQQFVDFTIRLIKSDLSVEEKTKKLLEGYANFYSLSEDKGLSQLQKIINKSELPISIEDGKLNLDAYESDESKIRALNSLLKVAGQEKEKEFRTFLGNEKLEDYQQKYEDAANDVLGKENVKILSEAMLEDNLGVIQRYTGNAAMSGMALTVVGSVLCFTPAAPLGAAMVTTGNYLAIGGMFAKTALGVADYATKDVKTEEELENLQKDFIMDAGGFIIGMKAGQAGVKAFSKLIDKKLAEVFAVQISENNRTQALKTVFSNPKYLKNFMTAAGAKISTDFLISYAGDLAMMGILDTKDDWKSLLQANLIGIVVGISGDIKDVAGVGKTKIRTSEPPHLRTEKTQNGINNTDITSRLESANSREDFVTIRDEIIRLPESDEKTQLKQKYVKKYNEWHSSPERADIKMQYIPEKSTPATSKREVSTETVKEIKQAVTDIRERYTDKERVITQYLKDVGFDEIGTMTSRIKSEQSLYDKIKNYITEKDNYTVEQAARDVRDAFGARTCVKSGDYKNHPEVKALLDAGNQKGAMLRAAELQSQPAVEKLKAIIDRQANGTADLEITRINNYVSDDGIPYFSENQLAELKQYGAERGVNIDYVTKIDKSDPNYANTQKEFKKPTTKSQPSGYTALQLNFKTKTGESIEWQFRGEEINKFAEGEHIPYDLRTNKDIIGTHKELEPLYQPIKELLSDKNMDKETFKEYNRYLTDYYTHLRKLELGFESVEPKLEDYGNGYKFDNRLSAQNLITLHDVADKLKNGKISQQEALNEYNKALVLPATKQAEPNHPKGIKTEREELIKYISENPKIKNNKNVMNKFNSIICCITTPEIIDLAKFVFENPTIRDNKNVMHNIVEIIRCTTRPEQVEAAKLILGNPDLRNNTKLMNQAVDIVYYTRKQEQIDFIKFITENNILKNNKPLKDKVGNIISKAYTPEKIEMAKYILEKPSLRNNENIIKSFENILDVTGDTKTLDAKKSIIEIILKNKELNNNKELMDNLGDIIFYTGKDNIHYKLEVINFILKDKSLIKNKELMKRLDDIIYETYSNRDEKRLKAILNNKSLMNNKDFDYDKIVSMAQESDEIEYCERTYDIIRRFDANKYPLKVLDAMLKYEFKIEYEDLEYLEKTIGVQEFNKWSIEGIAIASQFSGLAKLENIDEIPIEYRKTLLRKLVSVNTDLFAVSNNLGKDFPLIPRNQDEYCTLLPAIVRSLSFQNIPLKSGAEIEKFNTSLDNLSNSLAGLKDSEFEELSVTQEFSKDDFIKIVLQKTEQLSETERQKVCDYYGFELSSNKGNKDNGFSIIGYPSGSNNQNGLAHITDARTKDVIESLRIDVKRFTENNPIKSNNPQVEKLINEVIEVLPELRTAIGKTQHKAHDFDIMKHSLKVMQKITQDPKFEQLNESDKKIMMLTALMHDISKHEGVVDKTHADESSFDAFFISQKLNLSKEEKIKLYTLIKHHEWLKFVNTARNSSGNIQPAEMEKRLQTVAYDLRHDNLLEMAVMLTHADLKSVKSNDIFHDSTIGKGKTDSNGVPASYGKLADYYAELLRENIAKLQTTQPLLPITKIPAANTIKQAITSIARDGSTNLKGVYIKDNLVVIKYNEVENWEQLGFPKGSISRGITVNDINTGNIKFFVHGLDSPTQLAKFDAFSLVDSDALLSVSYTERPESKYRFFRPQGVILDVDTKYVHGGGKSDAGSGNCKSIKTFVFESMQESDKLYISNLIKDATGMDDSEYIKFVKENENKSFTEIEPAKYREQLLKAFATINSAQRLGGREYNEMYVSNPSVMGVFAYGKDEPVGNIADFFKKHSEDITFLKKFAIERNIPMIIFGD